MHLAGNLFIYIGIGIIIDEDGYVAEETAMSMLRPIMSLMQPKRAIRKSRKERPKFRSKKDL
jgi:hypothetical protein